MNHFRVHGQWLTSMPKSKSNYLQNLAPKLFQDSQNIVWVQLYKYPRMALFLPQKYWKLALCEAKKQSIWRPQRSTQNLH
jgi:hypothetical protein